MERNQIIITEKDKAEIIKIWDVVMKDPKSSGVLIFVNFFNDFPEYKNLFKKFERISMEDLPKSRQLRAHGIAVINSLNGMIENLDDPECLVELLLMNGKQHAHFGTTMEHYYNLWETVMKTFKQACGDLYTQDSEKAYRKLFAIMDMSINEGLISEGVSD
ncbi:unnamed protein product [Gordionus sp. m RMFG-2023]|uniref:globin-like n=1 Tax=Gordionus sp. m RMFG-2023 TaxID=3053472 RepID=UPI0030E525EA